MTKARILQAVREAKGETAAQLIEHLKKSEMAEKAQELLAGSGWLPEPLRTPGRAISTASVEVESGQVSRSNCEHTNPAECEGAGLGAEHPGQDDEILKDEPLIAAE